MSIGSVYIYASVGDVWSRQSKILPSDGAASDQWGTSVHVYGTTAMIGSLSDDDKASNAGMISLNVYAYKHVLSIIY